MHSNAQRIWRWSHRRARAVAVAALPLLHGPLLAQADGRGAAEPRPAEQLSAELQARLDWWSFRPLRPVALPAGAANDAHPIDAFLDAALAARQLRPAPPAAPAALLRRLSFALRGLPPSAAELADFQRDPSSAAWAARVDAWLDDPAFAETWARHWMDWLRYADSHGSEGDAPIPYAFRYRDYLVRALRQDVPYDQMVREHLAGDVLPAPRIDAATATNESALGAAQLRMVFHGYAPTEPLAERVRYTDDQIDVVSKAFLGLTVSCARCHDHKFDPISQRDYTALQGVFFACAPAVVDARVPTATDAQARAGLAASQAELRRALAERFLAAADELRARLARPDGELKAAIERAKDPGELLFPLARLAAGDAAPLQAWRAAANAATAAAGPAPVAQWQLQRDDDLAPWRRSGPGVQRTAAAGALTLANDGVRALRGIQPSGCYSGLGSATDRGVLLSPRVRLDAPLDLWLHVAGDAGAAVRPVVQDYPRDGSVYPITRLHGGGWRWVRFALDYWTGDEIHVELATAADQPVLADTGALASWFGVREVQLRPHGAPAPTASAGFAQSVLAAAGAREPATAAELAAIYAQAMAAAARAWRDGACSDGDALLLDALLRLDLLPNRTADLAEPVRERLRRCGDLQRQLAAPDRVPGVIEHAPRDAALLARGDHKQPTTLVPRRSLSLLGGAPCADAASGRLELARDWSRADNPLTSRVAVNRVWQVLFGRGLVATADNFGRLGAQPSHPELLDWLAQDFLAHGWSQKRLIRRIVTSAAWQRGTAAPTERARDPENVFYSHGAVRRASAEAVRDTLLALAGQLDAATIGGPSVAGSVPRRSLYVRQQRNAMDAFLAAFDAPVPASCAAQRLATNVPAQALTLLNDPFVWSCAEQWAAQPALGALPPPARVDAMYAAALGRAPSEGERARSLAFVAAEDAALAAQQQERAAIAAAHAQLQPQRDRAAAAVAAAIAGQRPPDVAPAQAFERAPLVLDAADRWQAHPLQKTVRAKTLIVSLQLADLRQRGGGAIAIEDAAGDVFDAIVFGEREPMRWMAGSERFARTQSFDGPEETEAHARRVHIAITWAEDGTVTCYRDGALYGRPYQASAPPEFAAATSFVALGVRHADPRRRSAPGADRLLAGTIFGAWVFDGALRPEAVRWHALTHAAVVAPELLAIAPPAVAADWRELTAAHEALRARARELAASPYPSTGWASLAHALCNHKEFVWLR